MKKYSIIYADPAWPDQGRGPGRFDTKVYADGAKNSRPIQYPCMSMDEIINLPVKNIADKNAHLYLWVPNRYIENVYTVARAWGFKPVVLLTWCKTPMGIGLGGTYIQTTEHLLFARRGILKATHRVPTTWFHGKRGGHSVKPALFRDMIVEISGDLPRIELFARQKTEGWDVWGNEVKSDIKL